MGQSNSLSRLLEATKVTPVQRDTLFLTDLKQLLNKAQQKEDFDLFLKKISQLMEYSSIDAVDSSYLRNKISFAERNLDYVRNQNTIGDFYLQKGVFFSDASKLKDAEIAFKKSLNFYTDSLNSNNALANYYLAEGLRNQGDFLNALHYANNASALFSKQKDTLNYLWSQMAIEILFSNNLLVQEANEIREKNRQTAIKIGANDLLTNSYATESMVARKLGDIDSEIGLLRKSSSYAKLAKGEQGSILDYMINCLLVISYGRKENTEQSTYFMKEVEKGYLIFKNSDRMRAFYNVAKAFNFYAQEKYTECRKLNLKNLDYFNRSQEKEGHILALQLMVLLNEKTNQVAEGYKYFQVLTTLKDSVFATAKTNQLVYYRTLFNTAQKDKEISNQKQALFQQQTMYKNRLRWLFFSVVCLGLLAGIWYLIKNQKLAERKKKEQKHFSQQLIQSQETERKRISKELHDGIGQSLILLQNRVEDSNTKQLLSSTLKEMRSFTQNLHPFVLEKFGLIMAIRQLADKIDENSDLFVVQEIEDCPKELTDIQSLNLYRITQECLTNTLKHSQSESVKISVRSSSDFLNINIIDHGKGFDTQKAFNSTNSLGMKTTKERAQLIGAKFEIKSTIGKGTTYLIEMPL